MRLVDVDNIVELYREGLKGQFESLGLYDVDVYSIDLSFFQNFIDSLPTVDNKDED